MIFVRLAIRICIHAFICIQFGLNASAQKNSNPFANEDSIYVKRENYVLSARNKLTIFVFANRYLNGILFTNPGINTYYFPIAPLNLGLGFSHKWLAVNIAPGIFKSPDAK